MSSSATFIDIRINNAEQLKESVSEPSPNTKMYLAYGRVEPWANDLDPQIANSSIATTYELWDNMIGAKRLYGSDFMHGLPRFNWSYGETYTAYDNLNSNLFDGNTKFYIMNADFSVYKCLSNNYSRPSTVEPISVNPFIVTTTSDGYIWKFMYNISDSEQIRFTTPSYIPVKHLTTDDGSLQYRVQDNAEDGAIHNIIVIDSGTGYTDPTNTTITITGDGTSATGYPTVNTLSNSVNAVVITDQGSGYTFASVTINAPVGTGANLRAIISPPGGHGSNPVYELGGSNIIINGRIRYDEEGVLPVNNEYRQICLLKDPLIKGTANTLSDSAFLQALTLVCVGAGDYQDDEFVYQGTSLSDSTFSGRVVSWNPTTSKLFLINTRGSPTASRSIIGSTSFTVRVLASVTSETAEKHSGRILYSDNIEPITRASDQIEDFKIVVRM